MACKYCNDGRCGCEHANTDAHKNCCIAKHFEATNIPKLPSLAPAVGTTITREYALKLREERKESNTSVRANRAYMNESMRYFEQALHYEKIDE